MNKHPLTTFARFAALLGLAAGASAAHAAGTTVYTDVASFQAASVSTVLINFEGLATGSHGASLTTQGVTITSLPGGAAQHDVFIAPAGNAYFDVPNGSAALTANGDENFRIARQDGAGFNAIGFAFYSNGYAAPAFYLFDAGGALIDKFTVAQAPSTLGFIGFTSTAPMAYLTTVVDQGWRTNTGIDDLRLGGIAAVPEAPAASLWLAGLAVVAGLSRRRSAGR